MLAGVFERCMKRRGVKETDPYDWEKIASESNATSPHLASNPPLASVTKPSGYEATLNSRFCENKKQWETETE